MKTHTNTNKMSKLLFTALASLVLMNAACSKSSSNNSTPATVVPTNCGYQPCAPGMVNGAQFLYGGTTTSGAYTQAQFQVMGDASGNGLGSITGVVNINNYVCQINQPNLNGQFTIQMAQQGYLSSDVFTGNVMLVGPQGTIPAAIKIVPTRTQGTGLFTLWFCGAENSMNF